jgi:peptide/nickel transport system substrate-binding protein
MTASTLTLASAGSAGGQDTVSFVVGTTQDVDSLNLLVGVLVIDYEVWNLHYATLTDKAAEDFSVQPGLAESWEESNDGLTYTYTLREGLEWSDGTPLTAEDIAYTINRSRDEEWPNHLATTQNLDATAIDERTVEITSSVPDPKLPVMDVYIVPKHVYEPLDAEEIYEYDALDGVGSGPFTITELSKGELVRMEKNPSWYGQEPVMDEVVFRIFQTLEAQASALQAGEIDAVDELPVELYDTIDADPDIELIAGNQGDFSELAMNSGCLTIGDGHPALAEKEVRQAINHAVDRELLLEQVIGGLGTVGSALPVSADPTWYADVIPEEDRFGYDPDRARQLLDEAGWTDDDGDGVRSKDGEDLRLRLFDRPGVETTPFIVEFLADVGIPTEVSTYDDTQLTPLLGAGEYDLFLWGWTPFVDPDPMLSYFTSAEVTNDAENYGYNDASWCNEEYDALYEEQNAELDPERRRELVAEMLQIFYEEAPYVVFYQYDIVQAIRNDRWTNFVRQPAETGPVLFTNTSPAYVQLQQVGAGGEAEGEAAPGEAQGAGDSDDDGGSSTGLIIGIVAAVVAVVAGGTYLLARRRRTADERE